jgi:NTP pyrophosphatase (non-canonical NTP hydrolase)
MLLKIDMNKQISEILNITLEECAEVTQAISKVFRFGFDSEHPNTPGITNKMHLEEEIGDLIAMINILQSKGILDGKTIGQAEFNKYNKLKRWSNIDL